MAECFSTGADGPCRQEQDFVHDKLNDKEFTDGDQTVGQGVKIDPVIPLAFQAVVPDRTFACRQRVYKNNCQRKNQDIP